MKPVTQEIYPEAPLRSPVEDAEKETLELWKARGIFQKSVEARRAAKPFVFYEGPPTANGRPGVHHVLARTVKDLICRYQTMRGRLVLRRGGWDTHGLPVELEVEKELGITRKPEIVERVGIAEFNRRCRESVFRYLGEWRELTERIAYWVDLEDEYVTLTNEYIESVWNLIRRIHERGLLYRDFKTVPYSTKSGTTLSDHEVALGYKDVDDPSVVVRFRMEKNPTCSFLVWTTTPWTLPGNTALAVNPEVTYLKVRLGEETVIVAEARMASVVRGESEVLERVRGRDLAGVRYIPLYDSYASNRAGHPKAFSVVEGDFVTTEDGTGIVHIAPGFGADDLETGRKYGLPIVCHVDDEGKMLPSVELVAGLWFKDADRPIVRDLERRGLLVSSGTYRHSYPFNWRGSDPLMYVARSAWYIRTTNIKERLVALNREITWVPEHIRDGRFGDWLENNVDWALSRERFWGTPLPIWVSDKDPEHCEVVGSVAELAKKAGRDLSGLDLHRPFVDEITWPDGRGGTMKRVPEVVDVWFDSGAMPFAQWHYPFANRAQAEAQFPADFICEGLDQTRGWFYSLHAISALVKDSCAYRACFVTGLLVGEDGQKMSKSLGNTVDPWEAVSIGGADSLRWFLVAANNPSGTMRFSRDGLREVSRKVLDTLKNLYLFFAQYANLDGYRPDVSNVPLAERSLLDRWVLSRLDSLVALCRESLDRFEISRAGRAISEFVIEDLSNWYVRRSRERFWAEGFEKDKRSAYDTLYECLVTVVRLAAPFIPFLTERIYLALNSGIDGREESVHLASYPEGSPSRIDRDLERRMENVRLVVRLGRAARNRANVKVRQPLARVKIVPAAGEEGLGALTEVALEELNVKEAAYGAPGSALAELSAKARFDVLGPRFGKDVKAIAQAIGALSTDRIVELESSGSLGIDTTAGRQEIRREEVQVVHEDPEGWVMERERGWSVALDLAIDDDLRDEGFAREIVNKIQFMRRKAGFAITDRIEVYFQGTEPLKRALETHGELIRHETQADELRSGGEEPAERESWDINGEPAVIGVRRVGSGQVLER